MLAGAVCHECGALVIAYDDVAECRNLDHLFIGEGEPVFDLGIELLLAGKRDGSVKLLMAEGESVPGPVLQIGNTNSRYRFSIGAKRFVNEWSRQGPAHHMAIGTGHIADRLECLAQLLGLKHHRVC